MTATFPGFGDISSGREESQALIERHNRQHFSAFQSAKKKPLTLKRALDQTDIKINSIYYLRILLNQQLHNCINNAPVPAKKRFLSLLTTEIAFKSTFSYSPLTMIRFQLLREKFQSF